MKAGEYPWDAVTTRRLMARRRRRCMPICSTPMLFPRFDKSCSGLISGSSDAAPAWTRPDFDPSILFDPGNLIHNAAVYAADISVLISIDTIKASIDLVRARD